VELLCQEYILQSERHLSHSSEKTINTRPAAHRRNRAVRLSRQARHRVPELDDKEREYIVVSMREKDTPAQSASK
jgi:hypothetical protein